MKKRKKWKILPPAGDQDDKLAEECAEFEALFDEKQKEN